MTGLQFPSYILGPTIYVSYGSRLVPISPPSPLTKGYTWLQRTRLHHLAFLCWGYLGTSLFLPLWVTEPSGWAKEHPFWWGLAENPNGPMCPLLGQTHMRPNTEGCSQHGQSNCWCEGPSLSWLSHLEEILSWLPVLAIGIFRKKGIVYFRGCICVPKSRGKKAQIPGTLTVSFLSKKQSQGLQTGSLGSEPHFRYL